MLKIFKNFAILIFLPYICIKKNDGSINNTYEHIMFIADGNC